MLRLPAIVGLLAVGISHLEGASPEDGDAAAIVNSGSTNRPGFRIVVDRSGVAELTATHGRLGAKQVRPPTRRTVPRALVEAFYADLQAAKPLDSLPAVHCAKSVSFGSTLIVVFGKEQTPDLSCGDRGNALMRDLIRDTSRIVALINVLVE